MPEAQSAAAAFDQALQRGNQAFAQGALAEADLSFRRCLELSPNNPVVLHNLGAVAYRRGDIQQAEELLSRARAGKSVPPETFLLLGQIYQSTKREAQALQCYETLLEAIPNHYQAAMLLGDLRDRLGDKPGARDSYRIAFEAQSTDIAAGIKYAKAVWPKEPAKTVTILEGLLGIAGTNLRIRCAVLEALILHKEWWERIKRGLAPYHATRVDELFYTHALPYVEDYAATCAALAEANPADAGAKIALGVAKFCLRDRAGAEEMFTAAPERTAGHILETVRFAPQFYTELAAFSDDDLLRGMPPIEDLTPKVPEPAGVLYLGCNFSYFRAFTLPMLCSLREHSPATPVHIHIMDASEAEAAFAVAFCEKLRPLRFAVSVERPNLQNAPVMEGRCYYHAVRLVRYYRHLIEYGCPLWLMDVDAVVNADLHPLFAQLGNSDAAMRVRPGRMEPWNQFNASIVGANTTEASLAYFRLVAAYLAYFFQRKQLRWGIDQLAMYGVFADLEARGKAPKLALLGEREIDYDYRPDAFVWCNSGVGKFRHLQRIAKPASMPMVNFEGNRFVEVFETRWGEVQAIARELGWQNI
jgi:tetratricopeptide (TPR) repeat protein